MRIEFDPAHVREIVAAWVDSRRPEPSIRHMVDLGFRIENLSVVIFEIRPDWKNPSIMHETAFAKATFTKSSGKWKLFAMRADLRWHSYPPRPEVRKIEQFFDEIDADPAGHFRG